MSLGQPKSDQPAGVCSSGVSNDDDGPVTCSPEASTPVAKISAFLGDLGGSQPLSVSVYPAVRGGKFSSELCPLHTAGVRSVTLPFSWYPRNSCCGGHCAALWGGHREREQRPTVVLWEVAVQQGFGWTTLCVYNTPPGVTQGLQRGGVGSAPYRWCLFIGSSGSASIGLSLHCQTSRICRGQAWLPGSRVELPGYLPRGLAGWVDSRSAANTSVHIPREWPLTYGDSLSPFSRGLALSPSHEGAPRSVSLLSLCHTPLVILRLILVQAL